MRIRKRALVVAGAIVAVLVAVLLGHGHGDQAKDGSGADDSDATHASSRARAHHAGASDLAARGIAGTVELDGKAVAGAKVRLASAWTFAGEPSIETDADGHFDFGPQAATDYVVVAEATGATGTVLRVDLRDPGVASDQLRLVLHECTASIHGKVNDAHGGGLAAAQVVVVTFDDVAGARAEAKADGSYELCVEPGEASIVVSADGYGELATRVSAYGRLRVDFELTPEAIVLGRAVRADTGAPIAGAHVLLLATDWLAADRDVARRTETDAAGNFRFDGVQPGAHEVTATADGLITARPRHVLAEVGAVPEPVVCALGQARTVTGTVVEHTGGAPIARARVTFTSRARDVQDGYAVTQPDGTFSIGSLAPETYEVYVTSYALTGKSPLVADVRNADAKLAIEVDRLASISGRVLRAGKPLDGVAVQARGPAPSRAVSDAAGRYTVGGLTPGTYSLYAESARDGAFTNGPSIAVARAEAKQGVDVVLDLAGSIAGTVVDQADRPVAGVKLRFSLVHGEDFGNATTADDGSFTARSLAGGGDYVYQITTSDGSQTLHAADGRRFAAIAVHDGNAHVTSVRIKVRFDRMAIAGHVLDATGAPVPDVSVRVAEQNSYWRAAASSTTDVAGAFRIKDLGPGTYDLMAASATGVEIAAKIDAGRSDVVIRLPALGSIEGTLVGFSPDVHVVALRLAGGSAHNYEADVTGTTFRVARVPEGKYQLVARSRAGAGDAAVEVTGGAVAKVSIQAQGFGTVIAHVIDATTKAPIADEECFASGGNMPVHSDATGYVTIENLRAGSTNIGCGGVAGYGSIQVTIAVGETARVDVAVQPRTVHPEGDIGMELEDQLDEVMVSRVTPGGPAARAGIAVSDIITMLDGAPGKDFGAYGALRRLKRQPGATVKLTLERDGNTLDVSLVVGPAPAP